MIFSLIGALIPHIPDLVGLLGKRRDDTTAVDGEVIKAIDDSLKYTSMRILIVVVVAVVVGLWAVAKIHDDVVHWNERDYDVLHLFGASGLSAAFRHAWSRILHPSRTASAAK